MHLKEKDFWFSNFSDRTYCAWRLVSSRHWIAIHISVCMHTVDSGLKTKDSLKIFKADVVDFFFVSGKERWYATQREREIGTKTMCLLTMKIKPYSHVSFHEKKKANGKQQLSLRCMVLDSLVLHLLLLLLLFFFLLMLLPCFYLCVFSVFWLCKAFGIWNLVWTGRKMKCAYSVVVIQVHLGLGFGCMLLSYMWLNHIRVCIHLLAMRTVGLICYLYVLFGIKRKLVAGISGSMLYLLV